MKKPSSKLVNLLIGKSLLETLLVSAVAVSVYLSAFPPTFHGWGEAVPVSRSIAGWAVNDASPWERVEVQLFIDGRFVGTQFASLSRPDVLAARWSRDEWHGYNFALTALSTGAHEARVFAVHQSGSGARYTLQLLGNPIEFVVEANGGWQATSKR
jgi:hypothetical protein